MNKAAERHIDWAIVIDKSQAACLATIWNVPSIQICAFDGKIWVGGPRLNEGDEPLIRSLPAEERFELRDGDQLYNLGQRLPVATLPDGEWASIREFLKVTIPPALFPAAMPSPFPMQLARTAFAQRSNVILTSFERWSEFATTAPQIRLQQLTFAVRKTGTTVVRGYPLPSLSGRQFVEKHGVALPAGFCWQPAVHSRTIAKRCDLQKGDLALFAKDATWSLVPATEFVAASRSAVRMTRTGRPPKLGTP